MILILCIVVDPPPPHRFVLCCVVQELRHAMLRAQRVASEARQDAAVERVRDEEEVNALVSFVFSINIFLLLVSPLPWFRIAHFSVGSLA